MSDSVDGIRLTAGPSATMEFEVSADVLALMTGIAPSEPPPRLRHEVRIDSVEAPMAPPRKRRGLTGKRYRIARRQYARTMRAWERGLIPGRYVTRVLYGYLVPETGVGVNGTYRFEAGLDLSGVIE